MRSVLLGGLAAGILDISYAFIRFGQRGVSPERILQSVASGLLGREAFNGGAGVAVLGLFLHFVVAILAATGFWVLWRLLPLIRAWPLTSGAIYGGGFYFLMNHVVVPLSKARPPSDNPIDFLGHVILIGIPLGFFYTRRMLNSKVI